MMQSPGNLVCTVGTSMFFSNLKNLDPEKQYQTQPQTNDPQILSDWESLRVCH